MGSKSKQEFGECQIEDCQNQAQMNLQLWEDGFVEGDLELCRKCGNFYFDKAARKANQGM